MAGNYYRQDEVRMVLGALGPATNIYLTVDQITELLSLCYAHTQRPIIEDRRRDVLTEVISLMHQILLGTPNGTWPKFVGYLTQVSNADELIFRQPALDMARLREMREPNIMTSEAESVPGLGKCSRCGSREVHMSQPYQASSGDEASLIKYSCTKCPNAWWTK